MKILPDHAWTLFLLRKGLPLLLFILPFIQLQAQMSYTDSLIAVLTKTGGGTERVDLLNELSYAFIRQIKTPDAQPYIDEANNLSYQILYDKGIAYSHFFSGMVLYNQKLFTSVREKHTQALEMFTTLKDTLGLARVNMQLANFLFKTQGYEESINYYKKALAMYEKAGPIEITEYKKYMLLGLSRIYSVSNIISDYSQSEEYSLKAIEFAEKINSIDDIGFAYMNLGFIHSNQNHHEEALEYFTKGLAVFDELKGTWDRDIKVYAAQAYFGIGRTYGRYLIDMEQSRKYYKKAIELFTELNDDFYLNTALQDFGVDLYNSSMFEEALEYSLMLLTRAEKLNDRKSTAEAHLNIGRIFLSNLNFEEAEKHLAKAYQLHEQLGNKKQIGDILFRQGRMMLDQGKKDEAVVLFKKANLIAKDIKDTFLLVTTYTNLLLQSIPLEDYASVIQCFNAQIKHDETIQNWNRAMTDYRFLGICYGITGAYAESHKSLTRSLELALKFDNALGIKTVYSSFHELYTRMQEYEKALEYSRLTVAWTDSMHLRTNRVLLTEMQAKYDTEKNEKEIQKLQSEKDINSLKLLVQEESLKRIRVEKDILFTENLFNNTQLNLLANEKELQQCVNEQHEINLQFQQSEIEQKEKEVQILNQESEIKTLALRRQKIVRNFLISGLGMFGLVGFLSYGFYLTRQRLRLQTLRNKIASDLHDDVGSTLSSIYIFSEIAREQSKEVIPMLDTIGESSKKMLDAMADIVWTINPENDDFEKILDRMRSFAYELLGARKIDFKFEAKASLNNIKLPMDVRKNLYLIFKEATNNLVKYSNANTAHFSIKEENKNLTMTITDNGKGFDTQSLSSGNGLKNMKKRAEEIDGKLWIESKREGGTTIKLSVAV